MVPANSRYRVLVIDDSRFLRHAVARQLRDLGFNVLEASNGREGLLLAKTGGPDVVVLDWMMPVLGGAEVIAGLRSDPSTYGLPVVVLTSLEQTDLAKKAEDNCYYMQKMHLQMDELVNAVELLLLSKTLPMSTAISNHSVA